LLDDATADEHTNARIAASRLLSLPWELLHDGKAYLSEGANPVRVRRRLPNYENQIPRITALPIRILLASPRPEQPGVGYLDHRASAKPLVAAVGSLGDLAELRVLNPPTLGALEQELKRAHDARQPYHVLHFDGHGVYDPEHGLGALCFEDPQDSEKLENRGMALVHADKLAGLLRDYRIPLVFLEACQTAQSEADPNASVAARLLEAGVSSVVAMSHSVLVETARRFTTAFYQRLAQGQRIGLAMLAGQTALMRDGHRLNIQGAGGLSLHDWFVSISIQKFPGNSVEYFPVEGLV
jgi:CHAT domain-containing protein